MSETPSPVRLEPAVLRELSAVSPGRSALHIGLEWAAIVGSAALCERWFSPWLYLPTLAFIGTRQHALIVLAHDAAHYRLFRNRTVNDWVAELCLAWPLLVLTMQGYRRNHLPHHRFLNTSRDPDWIRKQTAEWRFPQTRGQLARLLLSDALGVGFVKFLLVAFRLPRVQGVPSAQERLFARARLVFVLALFGGVALSGQWRLFLLYWLLPFVTWMQLAFRVRSIAEHFALRSGQGVYAQTRTVIASVVDRLFVAPKNVGYHLEHHLYPSVPFHRLPELHARLMAQEEYRAGAHVTRGYWNMLRECCARH